MNFDLNEEQKILKNSARSFLAKHCTGTFVRQMAKDEKGYSDDLWHKMAELGWLGILVPEEYGGSGGNFLDLAILLYEMGYACLPGPYFSTVVLGCVALLETGNGIHGEDVLPRVVRGEEILTLAWTEETGSYAPEDIFLEARQEGDYYLLRGKKVFVPYAHVAEKIICLARTDQPHRNPEESLSLFLVEGKSPGLIVRVLSTIADDRQCEVLFEDVMVPKKNLIGELNSGWPILERVFQKACVAKCAEMSGGARRAMEFVVSHVKQREQFGRPIGSFQAVKHHCANILTLVESCELLTFQTAWKISQGLPYEKDASMCKAWVSEAYRKALALCHQCMGGIGFMEEHDLQLYFRHAKASEVFLGDARLHREIVAEKMGL
jgi:alkylation response protein AidB-like acyl-CoA dehydrogenase